MRRRYDRQFRPTFSKLNRDEDLRWVAPLSVRYVLAVGGEWSAGKSAALAHLGERWHFRVYHRVALRSGLHDRTEDPAHLARLTLRRIHQDHLRQRRTAQPLPRIAVVGFEQPEEIKFFEKIGRFARIHLHAGRGLRLESDTVGELTDLEPLLTLKTLNTLPVANEWALAELGTAVDDAIAVLDRRYHPFF